MANNSTLQYGNYEFEKYGYTKVPEPKLNGGWFTGEKFNEGAGYGTVKVVPEIDYIMYENAAIATLTISRHCNSALQTPHC